MTASETAEGVIRAAEAGDDMARREFLNYAWLASLGILTLQTGIVSYQFAMPRLRAGEFGGPIDVGTVDDLPGTGEDPEAFSKAKFWWVVTEAGVLALYKVCPHLGCIFKWRPEEYKFICPCHGSQFERDGTYIQGPAGRSLDRFVVEAYDEDGSELATTGPEGGPVRVPPGSKVVVETGERIFGAPHA